jgi:hypothetical protein
MQLRLVLLSAYKYANCPRMHWFWFARKGLLLQEVIYPHKISYESPNVLNDLEPSIWRMQRQFALCKVSRRL